MSKQVLVVAAHPDDETLGVGGTIARHVQRGDRVCVLFVTDGVGARHDQAQTQKKVAREACAILGVDDVRFAGLPDQRLDGLALIEVIQPISEVIRDLAPDLLYTHHRGDANQDHRAVFSATVVAARPVVDPPIERVLIYEVPSSTEWAPPFPEWEFAPNVFVDVSATLETKLRALQAYDQTFESEVKRFPHPRSPEALRAYAQVRGVASNLEAAEAFVLFRERNS